jgi:hypothetical protein
MPDKIVYDESRDNEIKMACRTCATLTKHKIHASVDEAECHQDGSPYIIERYELAVCRGCDSVTFRYTSETHGDVDEDYEQIIHETLYPSRMVGRTIIDHSWAVPEPVRKIYFETHRALCSKQPILTGIGIRAIVETVCKEKNATGTRLPLKLTLLLNWAS